MVVRGEKGLCQTYNLEGLKKQHESRLIFGGRARARGGCITYVALFRILRVTRVIDSCCCSGNSLTRSAFTACNLFIVHCQCIADCTSPTMPI